MVTYNCFCFDCSGSKSRFQVTSETEPKEITCTNCGGVHTKILGQETGCFAKFGSMTPQDKQKVLKKRSNEHFKKEIQQKKQYLDRAAVGLER
jgi:predicted ATP-dependent serine protease